MHILQARLVLGSDTALDLLYRLLLEAEKEDFQVVEVVEEAGHPCLALGVVAEEEEEA
jgi:hypothetical protein